jgi:hypothetical protein
MNKRFDKQALRDEAQTHLPDMQYIGTDLIEPDTHALIGVTFAHEPTSEPIETQRHADRAAERLAIRHDSTNHIQVYELTITDDIHAMSHLLGNPPYDTDQIIIDDPPVYDEIKNAFTGIETYDTIPEAFQYAIETLRA